jgi:hypothetical protein
MRLYEQNQLVLAKPEGSYGDDSAPVAANAMLASSIKVNPLEGDVAKRNNFTGFMGNQGSIRTSQYVTVELEVELGGSGTKDLPPAYGVLYRACSWAEVITATTQVDYSLVSTGFESVSLYYYADKALHKVLGTYGSMSFKLGANGIPMAVFKLLGLYVKPTHAASPPAGDFSGFKLPLAVTDATVTTCTFFGQTVNMSDLTVDSGVNAEFVAVINNEGVDITGRAANVNITFEEPEITSINFFDLAQRSQYGALAYQLGTDVIDEGNIFECNVPQIQISSVDRTYNKGIAHLQIQGDVVPATKNSDFTFIHR